MFTPDEFLLFFKNLEPKIFAFARKKKDVKLPSDCIVYMDGYLKVYFESNGFHDMVYVEKEEFDKIYMETYNELFENKLNEL